MKKVKRFLRQFHMNDSMVMVGGGGRAGVTKKIWENCEGGRAGGARNIRKFEGVY